MSAAHFLPWFAVITCLELALIFFLLYRYVDAEKSNAIFSFLCLCFTCMIWSTYELAHAESVTLGFFNYRLQLTSVTFGLLMYRIQLTSGVFAAAASIHFARSIAQAAPAFVSAISSSAQQRFANRLYALTALIALFAWHSCILCRPNYPAPVTDYDSAMTGPLFIFYILTIFSGAVYACVIVAAAWKRERKSNRANAATGTEGYRAFAGQLSGLLLSLGLVLLASIVEFWQAVDGPRIKWDITVFPRAIAILIFCFTTAYSLAKQIVANERRKAQLKAVAQTRLEATRHTQHQVRNALAQIQRPLHNVLEQTPLPQNEIAQQEAANRQRIFRAVAAIQELHHTLDVALNLARVEVGEPLNIGAKESVAVAEWAETLCRQRLGLEEASSPASGNLLRLQFQADLDFGNVYVSVDALREVFAVLLDNACKYSPPYSLLTVHVWSAANQLCFCVADQGCGIRSEDQARIFELYRGQQPASGHIAGTGIGLTLAKRYMEAQGGDIRVESDGEGKGSAFYFHVPLELD